MSPHTPHTTHTTPHTVVKKPIDIDSHGLAVLRNLAGIQIIELNGRGRILRRGGGSRGVDFVEVEIEEENAR